MALEPGTSMARGGIAVGSEELHHWWKVQVLNPVVDRVALGVAVLEEFLALSENDGAHVFDACVGRIEAVRPLSNTDRASAVPYRTRLIEAGAAAIEIAAGVTAR